MDLVDTEMSTGDDNWTLIDLPYEVIEHILSYEGISHVDVCRISEVCHKLYDIANSRRLWHTKFCQAWGSLSELFDNHSVDWKENYQLRLKYGRHVQKLVASMCEEANRSHLVDRSFYKFKEFSEEYRFASHFMLDEMDSILCDGRRYSRLTTKFYCTRLLHFARQHHLKKCFQDFLNQYAHSRPPLDIGATLISQFCQPVRKIDYKDISRKLDDIARLVKEEVRQSSRNHPVLLKDIIPTTTDLKESLWPPSECRTILSCLNSTLFHSLRFQCYCEDEGFSSEQSFIDKALELEVGIPAMVVIIYASVAHRLGVLCEVSEPGCLKWLEHPMLDSANRYTFIDVTMCGRFYTAAESSVYTDYTVSRLYSSVYTMSSEIEFPPNSPLRVFQKLINNLPHTGGRDFDYLEDRLLFECSAHELTLILSPNDRETMLMLVELYLHMETRIYEAEDLLQQISALDPLFRHRVGGLYVELERCMKSFNKKARSQKLPEKKLRENCPAVLFAIGMIMRHKKYDYTCVIYGWDKVCSAGDQWIHQMRVVELRFKNKQPFYNVLVEDGTQRYAAQENLEFCSTPRFITHPEVGKYFDEFRNTHFVPNEMKSAEYPQDASARETMLSEIFTSHEVTSVNV